MNTLAPNIHSESGYSTLIAAIENQFKNDEFQTSIIKKSYLKPVKEYDIYSIQKDFVLNFPLLPWSPENSPSINFIYPELIIDPTVKPHKNPSNPLHFKQWLKSYKWNNPIAIIGLPGIGKSTLLKVLFLNYYDLVKKGVDYKPLILSIQDIFEFEKSEFQDIFSFLEARFNLPLDIKNISLFYLLDGLDEVSENDIIRLLNLMRRILKPKDLIWIACRNEFFYTKIGSQIEWNTFFHEILELQDWDIEKDSLKFANQYAKKIQRPDIFEKLKSLLLIEEKIKPFLQNPFELTLILYLLSGSETLSSDVFTNTY